MHTNWTSNTHQINISCASNARHMDINSTKAMTEAEATVKAMARAKGGRQIHVKWTSSGHQIDIGHFIPILDIHIANGHQMDIKWTSR